jgi:integrase/recombinase XerC/integrase/recombinase XerD
MEKLNLYAEECLSIMKSTKNISEYSYLAYRSDLNDFIKFCGDEINDEVLVKYVSHLSQDRHLCDTTISRKLITLKMFFEYLYNKNLIEQNYYQICHFKFRKERRLPKTLSKTEIAELLKTATAKRNSAKSHSEILRTSRNLALIDVLISTGIRIGEASTISLDDIIESEKTLLIHGKGRKQRLIYISCDETWNNLNNWLSIRKEMNISTDKLFVNRSGNKLGIHGIEYIYKQFKEHAAINSSSTPHYLRHTFATNLLSNGADLRSVQELLGHSSVAITEIYTEITTQRKKEILDKYNLRNIL